MIFLNMVVTRRLTVGAAILDVSCEPIIGFGKLIPTDAILAPQLPDGQVNDTRLDGAA